MSLREATYSATRWTTLATMARAALQVLQTIILARLLLPHDFGLMALAGVLVAVAALCADFGLSSALMHFPSPDRRTMSTIYWLNLGIACCLGLVFALAAWPFAHAFGQADLLPVLWWLSLAFPLGAIGLPFRVLAEKQLHFSVLATQEIAAAMLGFLVAIAVALAGGGAFALVAATLATASAGSILACLQLSAGVRPTAEFSLGASLPFFALECTGRRDSVEHTVFAGRCVHRRVVRVTGGAAFYTVPREQCLRISNTVVNPVVTRVGLPVMTR